MTDTHRRLSRGWLAILVVLVLVRIWIGALPETVPRGVQWNAIRLLSEAWVVAGLTIWVLAALPLRKVARSIGSVRSAVVAAFIVSVFVAQYWPAPNAYPFTAWSMYTRPIAAASYYEYTLMRDDRPLRHVPFADLVPSTSPRAFMSRLDRWVDSARRGDAEAHTLVQSLLTDMVWRAGGEEVDAVQVRSCVVRDPTPAEPARCENVLLIEAPTQEASAP